MTKSLMQSRKSESLFVVYLASPGGNLVAAINIGLSVRNSYLGFHASSGPLGTEVMAKYLAYIGLTSAQIDYMVRTHNSDIQIATEADALALGFHPQVVLFWLWQSCRAKYCLAVP
jgi:hypothetical protein